MIRVLLAVAAASAAALSAIAYAAEEPLVKYDSKCDWVSGIYRCYSKTETPHSITRTLCGSGANSACTSKTTSKEPPKPPPEPTVEHSDRGVVIMRGGPR
jgi:hypothetical protein